MKKLIFNFSKQIIDFPRSLSGYGVEQTLIHIKKHLKNMKINYFKSGQKCFDWKIPKEWNVKEAYILTPDGKKICNFNKNKLSLMGYSIPTTKEISKKKLNDHLYSLPKIPNAIPYVTSYYKNNWGFCITENERKKLKSGIYKVKIQTTLKKGKLLYGELFIKGKSKKEILLSTYVCHPQMANNEISGISVLTFLAKWIAKRKNNFSYRILFIPETIGSIAYISKNLKILKKNLIAGYIVTCVGDEGAFSYIPSRNGRTSSDVVAKKLLLSKKKFNLYSWLDRGSDERQFCSPGVDLPVCSITKTKYGTYKEYHTSLDKLGKVVTAKGLNESLILYKNIVKYFEANYHDQFFLPKTKNYCEPQLSKRDLYPHISTTSTKKNVRLITNILSYCDGNTSLIQIANFCNVKEKDVIKVLKILKKNNLIY